MSITRRTALSTIVGTSLAAGLPAWASETKTTIEVSFWDNPDMTMMSNLGYGMGGDMATASMGITISRDTAPAGEITFEGTNDSKDIEHEMIVAPLPADGQPLPYDQASARVDEDAAQSIGEIPELEPGASGTLTLHLDPGTFILYCNIPAHYMTGMWTLLTVS